MAKNKTMLYRQDGYIFALLFLQEHDLDQLGEEIRIRESTNIKTVLSFDEMDTDNGIRTMKGFVEQAHNLMWSRALRELGFAKKRISRNLERVISNRPETIKDYFYRRQYLDGLLRKILRERRWFDEPDTDLRLNRTTMEYIKEREDGLKYAYKYARENGPRAIKQLVSKTKFNVNMVIHENDYASDMCRALFNEVCIMEWLMSLHDLEGFGNKRLNRVMNHFETCYAKVMDKKEGFENYLEELDKVIGKRLDDDHLKISGQYEKVKHKKKKKKKPKEEPKAEPKVELPPIEEPDDYLSYPCPGCPSKSRCRSEGYQKECTCLALYKEVRKENLRRNIA